MNSVAPSRVSVPADVPGVVVGVDTHQDEHCAAVLDLRGAHLATCTMGANPAGYAQMCSWATRFGPVTAWGVEGTGSYGAGLARHLAGAGHIVLEVNRADRQARHQHGKSDPLDAVQAARAVLAGTTAGVPKTSDGVVEMIRNIKRVKDSATKAKTAAFNQLHAAVVTAPDQLRQQLRGLDGVRLLRACARLRPGPVTDPTAATKYAMRTLARRAQGLKAECDDADRHLDILTDQAAPTLRAAYGVGPDSAAELLIAAGDNPDRLASEASFAALCGVAPVPASSGKTNGRFRLSRGGNRRANAALYRIVLSRLRWDPETRAYMDRRTKEGMSKKEIIRCLKRYLARTLYRAVLTDYTAITAMT